jgi:hypothetical protein
MDQYVPDRQSEVYDSAFYASYPDTFSPKQTVEVGPQPLSTEAEDGGPCLNANNWKVLLPSSINEGVLYEDEEVLIDCKIQGIRFL